MDPPPLTTAAYTSAFVMPSPSITRAGNLQDPNYRDDAVER
jgi:hypothetical protein